MVTGNNTSASLHTWFNGTSGPRAVNRVEPVKICEAKVENGK